MPDPEEYLWREGEREAAMAEVEQRRQEIARAETLAWAEQRSGAPEKHANTMIKQPDVVTRGIPVTSGEISGGSLAAAEPDWNAWRKFILATVRGKFVTDKLLADVLKEVAKTDNEALAPLRAEIAALRAEVAELRVAALRRAEPASDAEARKRAGDIRRIAQDAARLRVA